MITKKGIYPWWNTLPKEEKMMIYFKYFSSGTYDDCIEWWDNLKVEKKIGIFNGWCVKE